MRDALIKQWLADTPWANWDWSPIPADASRRRYLRLSDPLGTQSAILMDAPPESGENIAPFVHIATHLTTAGFAAPRIRHIEPDAGLLVLEDLGTDDFSQYLRQHPNLEVPLYLAATEALADLAKIPAPEALTRLDPQTGAAMLAPFFDHVVTVGSSERNAIEIAIASALDALADLPMTLSLRDFHAENLIWRPHADGIQKVGLLDFQDALIAPTGYDLASLLFDARRDVAVETQEHCVQRFAAKSGQSVDRLQIAVATLSMQRNLRILGIFARLIRLDGKLRYRAFLARVASHVRSALDHPALQDPAKALKPLLNDLPLP